MRREAGSKVTFEAISDDRRVHFIDFKIPDAVDLLRSLRVSSAKVLQSTLFHRYEHY